MHVIHAERIITLFVPTSFYRGHLHHLFYDITNIVFKFHQSAAVWLVASRCLFVFIVCDVITGWPG